MKYSIFYHIVQNESEVFLSAGILVQDQNGKEIKRIFDVATDFTALNRLVNSLNEGKVALVHLECLLEDFYTEYF